MKFISWMVSLLPVLTLLGCTATAPKEAPTVITSENIATLLYNRQWELRSISTDGSQPLMDMQATMTLAFGADGKATGYGSVNRFTGPYSLASNGQLTWPGPGFATTRKAGPPELMEKERAYLEALRKTERAILYKHSLQLQAEGESTLLVFHEAGFPE
jgi:heat shock protein HslJ